MFHPCSTYNEPQQKEQYNYIAGVDLTLPNAGEHNVNYAIEPGLAMWRGNLTEEHEERGWETEDSPTWRGDKERASVLTFLS